MLFIFTPLNSTIDPSRTEALFQNGLSQRLSALEVGVDLGFDFTDDGQVAVDFGDDSGLFGAWRQRCWQFTQQPQWRKFLSCAFEARLQPLIQRELTGASSRNMSG